MDLQVTVLQALNNWCRAAIAGDVDAISALYLADATLHPTLDNHLHYTEEGRRKYFQFFLRNNGFKGIKIHGERVRVIDNFAFATGYYDFTTFDDEILKVRFTFSYTLQNGEWKIICHHSSFLPPNNIPDTN